jgi:hypothetical protein
VNQLTDSGSKFQLIRRHDTFGRQSLKSMQLDLNQRVRR